MRISKCKMGKPVFQGKSLSVFEAPGAGEFVLHHNEVVCVCVEDSIGHSLLLEQYRIPLGAISLEFSAGGIEPGERADDSARREVAEETGICVHNLNHLGSFYASSGSSNQQFHLFHARLSQVKPKVTLSKTEGINGYRWVSDAEAWELIRTGKLTNSHTMLGFMLKWATL